MKTILLLVASLLVTGCRGGGEEGTDLDDPKVREKIPKEAVALESIEERGPDEGEEPDLDDTEIREKILKEEVEGGSLVGRGPDGEKLAFCPSWLRGSDREKLVYQAGKQTPYTGWMKVRVNGLVRLSHYRDGKQDGLFAELYKNGQKKSEVHYKDGKMTKQARYKDGVEVEE